MKLWLKTPDTKQKRRDQGKKQLWLIDGLILKGLKGRRANGGKEGTPCPLPVGEVDDDGGGGEEEEKHLGASAGARRSTFSHMTRPPNLRRVQSKRLK